MANDPASIFRQLHHGPALLVLANAWDAGTARLIESVGAPAIATTSAGVAWSHGYIDGDALPLERLVTTVAEIVRVISVPLSVDFERGYAPDLAGIGDSVRAIVDAGAVGINLEDGSDPPDVLCAKIARVKQAAPDLFVNARTDVFLRAMGAPETRLDETLARARRYRDAGADGLFVPGVQTPDDIRRIAAEIALPLNVLAWPGLPSNTELHALGARRLSAGSGLTQAMYGRTATLARAFLAGAPIDAPDRMTHAEINQLIGDRRPSG